MNQQQQQQQKLFITPFISNFNIFNSTVSDNANEARTLYPYRELRVSEFIQSRTELVQSVFQTKISSIFVVFSFFLLFFHSHRIREMCVFRCGPFYKEANQCRDTCIFVISFQLRFHLLIIVNANQIRKIKKKYRTNTNKPKHETK